MPCSALVCLYCCVQVAAVLLAAPGEAPGSWSMKVGQDQLQHCLRDGNILGSCWDTAGQILICNFNHMCLLAKHMSWVGDTCEAERGIAVDHGVHCSPLLE